MPRSRTFWRFFMSLAGLGLITVALAGAVGTAGAAAAGLFFAAVLAHWLTQRTAGPLRDLTAGMETVAAGDYGAKVYTGGRDEAATAARAFNEMIDRLQLAFDRLEGDREQLRTILAGMVEGVIAIDAEQRVLFANTRAKGLFELPAATTGRRLWEIVRYPEFQDIVRRALAESEPCRADLTLGEPDRSVTVHAARLPGDPPRGAVMVLHDTSELKRLERLRRDFVANVSHELKTPLSVISACAETLLDGAADDADHRGRFLEQIADQSRRLNELILDLLSLARVESGAEAFDVQAVEVAPLVAECLDRHRARASEFVN